ncbi:unnamed protein product [Blepharisma stoltei]|uniref:GAR domain-containing protein n=1 Tax=Blepharisma stoltei TaxID=1481888 RepID=A0AAU9JEH1_9CILI|nr:unnamed protein product [Blepharisma stoltei]
MESKFIFLKLQEADIWSGSQEISCRVSIEGQIASLTLDSTVQLPLSHFSSDIQMHLLVQTENIALGSVTLSLEQVFGPDLAQKMDEWFEFEIPGEVVALVESSDSQGKVLRVRIVGVITGSQDFEFSGSEVKEEVPEAGKKSEAGGEDEAKGQTYIEYVEAKDIVQEYPEVIEENEGISQQKEESVDKEEENKNETEEKVEAQEEAAVIEEVKESPQIEEAKPAEEPTESKPEVIDIKPPEEIKERPDRVRPQPLPISGPIKSGKCSYLDNIKGADHHQKFTQHILDKLKDEMGQSFLKLVEDATRSRSRSPTRTGTRSPSKKLTARSPTKISGGSFSAASKEEEEFLEIAGNSDVFLEKLSLKTKNAFVASVVGLLAKKSIYEIQANETNPARDIIEIHEKASEILESSAVETKEEIDKEFNDYQETMTELTEEIKRYEESLQGLRKKNEMLGHEKVSVSQQLNSLKSQIVEHSPESEVSQLIEDIQDLRKAFENSQSKRNKVKNEFEEYVEDYNKRIDSLIIENLRSTETKSSLLDELKAKTHQLETLDQENDHLLKEIQLLEGQIDVESKQKTTLSTFQKASKTHELALDRIKSQVVSIRSSKDNYSTDAFSLQQQLESDIKKYKNLHISTQSDIQAKTEIANELKNKLKNLKDYIKQLEEIFAKKQNIDHVFEIVQSKGGHDFETKDMLVSELSYFSDFVFSLTQLYLKEHRIYKSLSAVFEEKEYDLNAMRRVVAEVKMQNPVYFPVNNDNIDQALAAYLNSRDEVVPVPFIREAAGVYLFGSRRVLVSFERGKLTVKVGGGFLPIDDFVECYCDAEFEKLNSKPEEKSPRMKKFMAKWVGGLIDYKENDDDAMKLRLIKAVQGHKYSTAYAVKDKSKSRSRSQSPAKLISDEIIAASIDEEVQVENS